MGVKLKKHLLELERLRFGYIGGMKKASTLTVMSG
jgi:hypothetical protein